MDQKYNPFITGHPIFVTKTPKFMETSESEDIKIINAIGGDSNDGKRY